MIEIEDIDRDLPLRKSPSRFFDDQIELKKTVETLFWGGGVFGAACSIPPLVKKKRIYSPFPTGGSLISSSSEPISLEEEKEPFLSSPPLEECTLDEKGAIREIFETLSLGMPGLSTGFRLYRLGKQIEHVHPFALLVSMPKEAMKEILKQKRFGVMSRVIQDIGASIEQKRREKRIDSYIPQFAISMGKEEVRIRRLIQEGGWEELLRYLFDTPLLHKG